MKNFLFRLALLLIFSLHSLSILAQACNGVQADIITNGTSTLDTTYFISGDSVHLSVSPQAGVNYNWFKPVTPNWTYLGGGGLSSAGTYYTDMAIALDGTRYIAFQDGLNSNKATVMKHNGTAWVVLGSAGFSAGRVDYVSLAIHPDGTPYVAYKDAANSDRATVMKYDGSSWINVGSAGFTVGTANYTDLAITPNGTPYVAFSDGANTNRLTMMYYDGSNWAFAGSAGITVGPIVQPSIIAGSDGKLYTAFRDDGNSGKLSVFSYTPDFGGSWTVLGLPSGITTSAIYFPSIALTSANVPYVAFSDQTNSYKASVVYYNSGNNNWLSLGSPGFSSGVAEHISMAFDPDDTPYLAYTDAANSHKATTMYFDGSAWQALGAASFTSNQAATTNLAIAEDGTPYIAFADLAHSNKVSVMHYKTKEPVALNTSGIYVSDTGQYLVWAMDASTCAAFDTVYVDTLANGVSLALSGDSAVCFGHLGSISSQTSHGLEPYSYSWSHGGAATSISNLAAGTYTLTVTDLLGHTDVVSHTIASYAEITASIIQGDTAYYVLGDSVQLSVNPQSGIVYDWYKPVSEAWHDVADPGISAGQADYTNLAFNSGGTPYLAYMDVGNGYKATVKKFDNGNWINVGNAGFSSGASVYLSLDIAPNGTPYVAYRDGANSNHASVMYYNGSTWQVLGNAGFSASQAIYTDIAIAPNGTPYVVYQDVANGYRATVMYYDGSAWQTLGIPGFSIGGANIPRIAIASNGTPYVAYQANSFSQKAAVMYYDGSAWQILGTNGFSTGIANGLDIALSSDGSPYVSFQDAANSSKATVMHYNGSSWQNVGNAGFSAGQVNYPSLALSASGTPYLAYLDLANSAKATAMYYDGSSWQNVGNVGFSAGGGSFTDIAITADGNPYVAYADASSGNKATVMQYSDKDFVVRNSASTYVSDSVKYVLRARNAYGCEVFDSITIRAVSHITVNLSGNSQICVGETGLISATVSEGKRPYTYLWSNGATSETVFNLPAGTYSFTATDDLGYKDSATFTISSYPDITPSITGGDTAYYISGDSVQLSVNALSGVTYDWYRVLPENWSDLGSTGFSSGEADYTSLALASNGTPYVAYMDIANGYKATVKKYENGSWSNVGNASFSSGVANYINLAVAPNGSPYVAYRDGARSNNATVMFFNGSAWQILGTAGFSAGQAIYTDIAIAPDGSPYVVYQDVANGYRATVMYFDGTDWQTLGIAGFSNGAANNPSIAIALDGTPYVAYQATGNSSKASVMYYDGSAWQTLGTHGFSAGAANAISLALASDGTPYVSYQDAANASKATVMHYTGGSWQAVGSAGFSAGSVNYPSIALSPNSTPYVVYKDLVSNDLNATVKYFDGSAWRNAGNASFSSSTADFTSIAIAKDGTPYVVYSDHALLQKATVMYLKSKELVYEDTSAVYVSDTGNYIAEASNAGFCWAADTIYVDSLQASVSVNLFADTTICFGEKGAINSLVRFGLKPYSYSWSNGSSTERISNLNHGAYTLTVTDALGHVDSASLSISAFSNSTPIIAQGDTAYYISGDSVQLSASYQAGLSRKWYKSIATDWLLLGNQAISTGQAYVSSVITALDGTLYVAYLDVSAASKATVKYHNGISWQTLGTAGFSAGLASNISLALGPDGTLYAGYGDGANSQKATVMYFDGSTWQTLGTAGFSANAVSNTSLAIGADGTAYIGFRDNASGFRSTVMYYDGSVWQALGEAGFSNGPADHTNLIISNNNTPYLAYFDGGSGLITVSYYNGSLWQRLGGNGIAVSSVGRISLDLSSEGTPYVAYTDGGNSNTVNVRYYNGSNWQALGVSVISAGSANYPSIKLNSDDLPYVAYRDDANSQKASLRYYDGSNWQTLGSTGFSSGSVSHTNLAIGPDGTPYVAYTDVGNSTKATVLQFTGKELIASDTSSIFTSDTGTYILEYRNSGNCFAYDSIYVDSVATRVSMSLWGDSILCAGESNAFIKSIVNNGLAPYAYEWSNGQTTADVANLAAATYTLVVTDAAGFKDSADFTVTDYSFNSMNILQGDTTYYISGDSIQLTVNAQSGITYDWFKPLSEDWYSLAPTEISSDVAQYLSLELAPNGNPYLAYRDWASSSKATVKYHDGQNWLTLGNAGLSAGIVSFCDLEFGPNGTPYLAYKDNGNSGKATTMQYNGSSWQSLGNAGFSEGAIQYMSMAVAADGTPFVAYRDDANSSKATVMYYDGTNWKNLGTKGFSAGSSNYISLDIGPTGTPYVAYQDIGNSSEATVMYYTDSSWQVLGTAGFSSGLASYTSLAVSPENIPYVAFQDQSNSDKITVMSYLNGAWQTVGTAGFSSGTASFVRLFISADGTPYVAYLEQDNASMAAVKYYDGSSWQSLGNTSFSNGGASHPSFTIATDGTAYLAYGDNANSSKATLRTFTNKTWLAKDTSAIYVSDTGVYAVQATNAGDCRAYDSIYVDSVAGPIEVIISGDSVLCFGTTNVTLNSRVTNAIAPISLLWNTGATTESITIQSGGTYSLVVTDARGETDSTSITVTSYPNMAAAILQGDTAYYRSGDSVQLAVNPQNGVSYDWYKSVPESWYILGKGGFSFGNAAVSTLAIAPDGTRYVAYQDWSYSAKATVVYFDGSAWQTLGNPGFSSDAVTQISVVIAPNGTPYVAYRDIGNSNKATVMYYNGSTWQILGNAGFSSGSVFKISLAFESNGTPYVSFQDGANSDKATVMYYDGSRWQTLGNAGFSSGQAIHPSLAIASDGTKYIAFGGAPSGKAVVMYYNGSTWQNLGNTEFSDAIAYDNKLAINSQGVVYLAYRDVFNSHKATVKYYDGSSWQTLGTAGFSPGQASYISFAISADGTPYVAFQDRANSDKASLMRYQGGNWQNVGVPGFSPGTAEFTSLAIAENGILHLAFLDGANSNRPTVMNFIDKEWLARASASIYVSDSGDYAVQATNAGNCTATDMAYVGLDSNAHYNIVISEIMYNAGRGNDEWIELYVNQSSAANLTNYTVKVNDTKVFTFPANSNEASGNYVSLALGSDGDGSFNNLNPFTPDYNSLGVSNSNVAATTNSNRIPDSTATITLTNGSGGIIDQVVYNKGHVSFTNGFGPSIEIVDTASDNSSTTSNWRNSVNGGSPGGSPITYHYNNGVWTPSNPLQGGINAFDNIEISSGLLNISSNLQVGNITLAPKTLLHVNDGVVLNALGNVLLNADASGYAQLKGDVRVIGDGLYGQFEIEAFLSASRTDTSYWFNIASPMVGGTIADLSVSDGSIITPSTGNANQVNIYYYNPDVQNPNTLQGSWTAVPDSNFSTDNRGFSLYLGAPWFGTLPITLTAKGDSIANGNKDLVLSPANGGWNFIANPYPSVLDWNSFFDLESPQNLSPAYWVAKEGTFRSFDADMNDSVNLGTSGLAPLQALFVEASANQTLSFKNNHRNINKKPVRHKSNTNSGFIRLKASATGGGSDETVIGFGSTYTDGFDLNLDGLKRFNYEDRVPNLYTTDSLDNSFTYNKLNNRFSSKVIPMSLESDLHGQYEISIANDQLPSSWTVELKDLESQNTVDLRKAPYLFTHYSSDFKERFEVLINTNPLGFNEVKSNDFQVFVEDNMLVVESDVHNAEVQVINLNGQLVRETELNGNTRINLSGLSRAVYLIRINKENITLHTQKVFK